MVTEDTEILGNHEKAGLPPGVSVFSVPLCVLCDRFASFPLQPRLDHELGVQIGPDRRPGGGIGHGEEAPAAAGADINVWSCRAQLRVTTICASLIAPMHRKEG